MSSNTTMRAEILYGLGFVFIIVGVLIILVAILLLFFRSIKKEGKIKGGGAVIIGPFPIIFGTNKESIKMVLLLSLALIILLFIIMVIVHLVLR